MQTGLVGRILLAGGILVAFLLAELVLFLSLAGSDGRALVAVGAGLVGTLALFAALAVWFLRAHNELACSLERSRAELERQVTVNRTVLDSTVDGICLTDAAGRLVLANRPLIQFVLDLGLPQTEHVQEALLSVADRFADPDGYRAAIGRIMPELDESTFDEFQFRDDGRCFQGFTAPVREADGALAGRVWTLREVTAERASDRLKDEFIATVTHELRTPLTSINGFLEMLLDDQTGPLTPEQRRFLEIVMRSSQRLMRQVGDVLFVAQLDSNGLQLNREGVRLEELVAECVEQVAALARQREIELELALSAELPEVSADRERIAQVVANLLSNALKFTPPGGRVAVRVRAGDGRAVIEVEDSGIGIPAAERERLFERFFRSSVATQRAIQGTGLGLAISKAIVERHGGSIAAEPVDPQGMCFRVELPVGVTLGR